MTISAHLTNSARRFDSKPAIIFKEKSVSFAELNSHGFSLTWRVTARPESPPSVRNLDAVVVLGQTRGR